MGELGATFYKARLACVLERYDRQLAWLRRRLAPGQYLGLHLTLGLLAAAGCLWLFVDLAENLYGNDALVGFEEAIAIALHNSATPALTTFFLFVTALGSLARIALVGLLIFVVLFVVGRRPFLEMWLAAAGAVLGSLALVELLKALFTRPRPNFVDPLLSESATASQAGTHWSHWLSMGCWPTSPFSPSKPGGLWRPSSAARRCWCS